MMEKTTKTKRKARTEEEIKILRSAIREDAIRGLTRPEIAAKHQISHSHVCRVTKGMKMVTLRDHQHARHERFCTLFKKGMKVSVIRELEHVSNDTVIKVLKATGLWQKKLDEKAAFRAQVLQYWIETRATLAHVSTKFGIGKYQTHSILAKHPEYDGRAVKSAYMYKTIQIPEHEQAAILKMRDELNTIEYISTKFGYGRGAMARFLKANGRDWHLKKKRGKWWVPPEDVADIIRCRQSGMTLKETSAKTGYHKRVITIVCHRNGHKGIGTRSPLSVDECETIRRLRKGGASTKRIAKQVNRGQKIVVSFLKSNGFKVVPKTKLTATEQDFIKLARAEGATVRQLARTLGRHFGTVKRFCFKHGQGRIWKFPKTCHLKAFICRLQGVK